MECDWYYEWSYCRENAQLAENEILVQVPFCGTYEALDVLITSDVECEQEYLEENPQEGYEDGFYASFDMKSFLDRYVKFIGSECGLQSLKFQNIYSPREYNFSTDTVYASVDKNELWELYEKIKDSEAYAAEVKKWGTSCDGYVAYYTVSDYYYDTIDSMLNDFLGRDAMLGLILNAKMTHYLNDMYTDPDEDTTVDTVGIIINFQDETPLSEYLHY